MGKADGFLLYSRLENKERSPEERILDFKEIRLGSKEENRREQAARCMNCGVPMCQSGMRLAGMVTGCPLHNLIPEWNDHIYRKNDAHALGRLIKTNPFPEFTGRVCPALCEKACINGLDDNPVTIRDNELYLAEYGFDHHLITAQIPKKRSDKKIAVIGSGPAGMSAAQRLNYRGHAVTVFEREDEIGGLLMYGIPNMKLDKEVIRRRRRLMEKSGIQFLTNTNVGKDVSLKEIYEQFDAVILACGAKQARVPEIENMEGTDGVIMAVDFLTAATKCLPDLPKVNAQGKNVIILGGGDTGNDCVGTCIRQGCCSVIQIEMMPMPPKERAENNPWPQWPKVLKTDYGQEEAVHVFGKDPRVFSHTITRLIKEDNKVVEAETAEVHFIEGRLVPSEEREVISCDLLIIAAGFTGCEKELVSSNGIELSARNTVKTDQGKFATSKEGIFTAGDMHRGQSLVVWAIAEGLQCAKEVDEWLMGYTNLL